MSVEELSSASVNYFQNRIERRAKAKVHVIYNTYAIDSKGAPINNIDDIAVNGTVRFFRPANPFSSHHGKTFKSPVITDPRWIDVAILANKSIKKTKDYLNIVLDGIEKCPYNDNIYTFCLSRKDE